jgi:spore cortex formation protein SpoVR/YcgB (stage V sporulation)
MSDRLTARRIANDLQTPVEEAANLAGKLGLDPYPVNYWIVDHDEMNQLIAYDGFQTRYPHWRWGMKYDRQRKQTQFLGGKAFEIVNNDDPAHAFLQESNSLADQKAVITHVEAHADFFAHNQWFGLFSGGETPNAAAMLARHADTIDEYMSDPEIDREDVERWIDTIQCLDTNIDRHRAFSSATEADGETVELDDIADQLDELDLGGEVVDEVFDEEWLESQRDDEETATIPKEPEQDLLAFLWRHGMAYNDEAGKAVEMTEWQRDTLEILRREAYYFAAQRMTKVMNEGWACVAPNTPVFTTEGLITMKETVENQVPVSDGETERDVYDSNVIPDHDTVTVETRRGFELTGSNNHRIRRPDGSWVRLDELNTGDEIEITGGNDIWPTERVSLDWEPPHATTLQDIADEANVSVWTVLRYRRTGRAERADAIESALSGYDGEDRSAAQRDAIRIPGAVTEKLGRFLGLLVGDGHVSSAAGQVGFTNGSREHAEQFAGLADELFGVTPTVEEDGARWRANVYSRNLIEFFTEAVGLPDGKAAGRKTAPEQVLRSPRSVVAEFLRGLFDADGYAGEQGVILSTKSEALSGTVQLLLSNFGALSRRRKQTDGCYHVHLTGQSARTFGEEIGFGFPEKASALRTYLDDLSWFEDESWSDEITNIREGTGAVYDISVRDTHRYAGAGFVNHNSYWESMMMGEETFAGADEFLNYADHQARVLGSPGLNPYKLGKELWEYIENSVNRREVIERLLRVEGITWRNFHDVIDFDAVQDHLAPDPMVDVITADRLDAPDPADPRIDADALERARAGEIDVGSYPWKVLTQRGMAERHYSLAKPQNRGFVRRTGREELERVSRYLFDGARYASVDDALAEVDRSAGWDRLFEIRESHNDVTFIDEFLTQEFVDDNDYFTYEYTRATQDFRATSTDYEDVKKKLLLQFTNFGKPTITVHDGNYNNRNELLLAHHYNGVMLDIEQAKQTLERVYDLWGRPVNLKTVVKEVDEHDLEVAKRREREPEPEERGKLIRYDGESFTTEELAWEAVEGIAATDVDYDTKPDEWLA